MSRASQECLMIDYMYFLLQKDHKGFKTIDILLFINDFFVVYHFIFYSKLGIES